MSKPRLPPQLEARIPDDVLRYLYTFVPRIPKQKVTSVSPGTQKALEAIQRSPKRTAMDMYGLDDFVLR